MRRGGCIDDVAHGEALVMETGRFDISGSLGILTT
jgi:hypothetical protein